MFTPNQTVFIPDWNGDFYVTREATIKALHTAINSTITEQGEAKSTQSTIDIVDVGYRGESDVYSTLEEAQKRVTELNTEYLEAFEKQYVEMTETLNKVRAVVNG